MADGPLVRRVERGGPSGRARGGIDGVQIEFSGLRPRLILHIVGQVKSGRRLSTPTHTLITLSPHVVSGHFFRALDECSVISVDLGHHADYDGTCICVVTDR